MLSTTKPLKVSMLKNLLEKKLVRYIIAGGSAYVFEMGSLYIAHAVLGLSPVTSVAISFWVGFITAFVLQKIFTFKNYEKHLRAISKQLVGYGLLVAWNYIFTLFCVSYFQKFVSVYIIRTLTIAIIVSWNYIIYKQLFGEVAE